MNKSIVMILVGAGMALSLPSWGHSDDYLDTLATPHGGQLRMAGPYHFEVPLVFRLPRGGVHATSFSFC